nr:uncharacterized protein LOC111775150 [Equus caballus]
MQLQTAPTRSRTRPNCQGGSGPTPRSKRPAPALGPRQPAKGQPGRTPGLRSARSRRTHTGTRRRPAPTERSPRRRSPAAPPARPGGRAARAGRAGRGPAPTPAAGLRHSPGGREGRCAAAGYLWPVRPEGGQEGARESEEGDDPQGGRRRPGWARFLLGPTTGPSPPAGRRPAEPPGPRTTASLAAAVVCNPWEPMLWARRGDCAGWPSEAQGARRGRERDAGALGGRWARRERARSCTAGQSALGTWL